jgi:hypothetical protein
LWSPTDIKVDPATGSRDAAGLLFDIEHQPHSALTDLVRDFLGAA